MLILLSVASYLGNIYHYSSSSLKTNMLTDFDAVITTFYSIYTHWWENSPGLYILKLKVNIFPVV